MTTSMSAEGRQPGSGGDAPLLRLDGVVAGYGGGDVLHGVTFDVQPGSITCIVGPNGAGKSTLLATISGLLQPRLGEVLFRGESLVGRSPRDILNLGLVLVPQERSLFPRMTVKENVEMGAYTVRDRRIIAERMARVTSVFPIVARRAKAKAGSLSGGQQRLVEFARCLMLDPVLVVLDEPSMGLDPHTLAGVFRTIRRMNADGRTLLLVEQNARAGLKLSSHGVVMENGSVRLQGSGREVLEHPEIGTLYLGGEAPQSAAHRETTQR